MSFVNIQAEETLLKFIVQKKDITLLSTVNEEWLTEDRNNLLHVLRTKEECLDYFYCTQYVEENSIEVNYPLIFRVYKENIEEELEMVLVILEEKYLKRQVNKQGEYIISNIAKKSPLVIAADVETGLQQLRYVGRKVERLGDKFEADSMELIDIGVPEMNDLCLSKKELMLLGGERGHHKTNVALYMMGAALEHNVVNLKNENFKVLFFSREMSFKVVKARIISKLFRIKFTEVRRGNYNIPEIEKMFREKYWYYHENFVIIPPEAIRNVDDMGKFILQEKSTIWCLDYMQLLARGMAGKDGNVDSVIAWLATRLKSLAQMTDTLGIGISTLKKFENQRISHIPRLEDLYSSVELQYLASWIGLCYWSWFYDRSLNKKPFFVLWEKNRNEEPYTMQLGVEPEFSAFSGLKTGSLNLKSYLPGYVP